MVNQITSLSYAIESGHVSKELSADFEKAITFCGYGKFHHRFVLLCGLMFFCCGAQNSISAYILPSAECDLHLTSEQKGYLNVAFLIGGVISSLFWGVIADAYGRRFVLLITMTIDGIVTLVSSFSQSYQMLLIFRGISGFAMGAPGALVYTYLGEFLSDKYRTKNICYVGLFWTLSWLVLPGLAWIIIPLPFSIEFYGMLYNSWRLFLAVIGIPTLLVVFIATTYPESPKFLLSQGKSEEALNILKRIYSANTGRAEHEYPVKFLLLDSRCLVENSGEKKPDKNGMLTELLKNIWLQIQSIASPPLLKYALLCWTIFFANMFGYYGFGLWMPELFNRFENFHRTHPDRSIAVCGLMREHEAPVNHTFIQNERLPSSNVTHQQCTGGMIQEQVFINALITNAVCLIANFASGYFANRVSRRVIPVTTMLIAGISGLIIYFVRSSVQMLLVACAFSMMISTANFVIGGVVVDVFPTHVGAVAICMMTLCGRIGAIVSNLAFGLLLEISCEIPVFLMAGVVLFGGLLCFLIPVKKS